MTAADERESMTMSRSTPWPQWVPECMMAPRNGPIGAREGSMDGACGSGRPRARRAIRLLQVLSAMCCGALLAVPGAAAQGSKADLVCVFEAEFTFSPALNSNTTNAVARGLMSSCGTPSGRYPRIKSGVLFASTPLRASGCSPAPMTINGTGSTLHWNDGTTSTFDTNVSTDPRQGDLGIAAVVTDGRFKGGRMAAIPAILAQNGLCGLGGVRSLTLGFGVATITAPASRQRHPSARRPLRLGGRHRGGGE